MEIRRVTVRDGRAPRLSPLRLEEAGDELLPSAKNLCNEKSASYVVAAAVAAAVLAIRLRGDEESAVDASQDEGVTADPGFLQHGDRTSTRFAASPHPGLLPGRGGVTTFSRRVLLGMSSKTKASG